MYPCAVDTLNPSCTCPVRSVWFDPDTQLSRFLVLLRHVLWMHTKRQNSVPPPLVGDKAWVVDGVSVALARRHQYTSGRAHTTRPGHRGTRVQAFAAFRDRLMIPDPHLRAVLARLVSAGDKGMLCCEHTAQLVQWLQDKSERGGSHLAPYVRLCMVMSVTLCNVGTDQYAAGGCSSPCVAPRSVCCCEHVSESMST